MSFPPSLAAPNHKNVCRPDFTAGTFAKYGSDQIFMVALHPILGFEEKLVDEAATVAMKAAIDMGQYLGRAVTVHTIPDREPFYEGLGFQKLEVVAGPAHDLEVGLGTLMVWLPKVVTHENDIIELEERMKALTLPSVVESQPMTMTLAFRPKPKGN